MVELLKGLFESGNNVAEAVLTSGEISNVNLPTGKRIALLVKLVTVLGSVGATLLLALVMVVGFLKKTPHEGEHVQEELRRQDERLRSLERKHAEEIRRLAQGVHGNQIVPVRANIANEAQKQLEPLVARNHADELRQKDEQIRRLARDRKAEADNLRQKEEKLRQLAKDLQVEKEARAAERAEAAKLKEHLSKSREKFSALQSAREKRSSKAPVQQPPVERHQKLGSTNPAESELARSTPVRATIYFNTGRPYQGTLVKVEPDAVRFKLLVRPNAVAARYTTDQIRAIYLATGHAYVWNSSAQQWVGR